MLRETKTSIDLRSSDPDRLIYILQNARHVEEYRFLSRFRFTVKDNIVKCILLDSLDITPEIIVGIIYEEPAGLVDIANKLIVEKPSSIRYTNPILSEDDKANLSKLCSGANYDMIESNNTITFVRK